MPTNGAQSARLQGLTDRLTSVRAPTLPAR